MDFKTLFQNKWLLAMAGIGILLLLVGSFFPPKADRPALSESVSVSQGSQPQTGTENTSGTNQAMTVEQIEAGYDQNLQQILSQIQGIHSIHVMVTVDSSGILTVAKNDSSSKTVSGSGSTQSTTTSQSDQIYSGGNGVGGSGPYVLSTVQPNVRGVLVTVSADDFVVAKSEIIESITNVLDVPAYKISVEPQKGN
ncbi:hypothetical protein [Alicyclobacillus dauci]|uniref:Stage III sporulation protein AG n=1 Tax=Alicyclobacillus dauci TaxID=1475485 RepID=A0ABY6Z7Z4_9BACL|nr:hypothetical protein [Alicyclobacillus dauci]WAH39001.1 hypothetical protein NZD86_11220 [Alicyclobacillus dauci]